MLRAGAVRDKARAETRRLSGGSIRDLDQLSAPAASPPASTVKPIMPRGRASCESRP